jgi:hypothetical protein
MDTIEQQIIRPILKRTASLTEEACAFLGEMKRVPPRPRLAKKTVSIMEDHNCVGLTYSAMQYDRSKGQISDETKQLIKEMREGSSGSSSGSGSSSCNAVVSFVEPCPSPLGMEMDLILTEQSSYSLGHWDLSASNGYGGSGSGSNEISGEFRPGEWADMFLSMGQTI